MIDYCVVRRSDGAIVSGGAQKNLASVEIRYPETEFQILSGVEFPGRRMQYIDGKMVPDTTPTVEQEELVKLSTDSTLRLLSHATPEQIAAWVDGNSGTLAEVRGVLKIILRVLARYLRGQGVG